jgi:hypothetical protein
MTEEVLNIREGFVNDDSVESFQFIEKDTDQGVASLNASGEITITFQNQDAWFLPSESYLRIEGNLVTNAGGALGDDAAVAFVNNGILQLFSTVRYYLGTQVIEYFENAGISTTIHNYLTKSRNYQGQGWFWLPDSVVSDVGANNVSWRQRKYMINTQAANSNWNFSVMVPLSAIFNFCNDYKKVIYGMQHRISLTRTTDTRALMRSAAAVAASGYFAADVALANDAKIVFLH